MEFFDNLYSIVGLVPYNENPLISRVYSDNLIKIKDLAQNMIKRLNYYNSLIT
jgi:hypothetical protein